MLLLLLCTTKCVIQDRCDGAKKPGTLAMVARHLSTRSALGSALASLAVLRRCYSLRKLSELHTRTARVHCATAGTKLQQHNLS